MLIDKMGLDKTTPSAYLDGQLTQDEANCYLSHVETCAGCRTYLTELERVSLLLKSVGSRICPPEFRRQVMSVISVE
jgi:anti-sigma factor RsiW